jgi:hypothetical protein
VIVLVCVVQVKQGSSLGYLILTVYDVGALFAIDRMTLTPW